MAIVNCKMCGGELNLPEGCLCGSCAYCGSLVTFPKVSTDQLEQLYNRAEHFRRINDYDKAVSAYERLIAASQDDPEAYWGLVLSRFGIEYVEDPVSHERIPTCHRVQFESILADADYLAALEYAGSYEREIYEKEAKRIAEIQKGILAISSNEEPFDVFICYKESDEQGKRTRDSVLAQDIYYALTQEGFKVFFARITLEDKLGQQYEPYIFAALNSAKAMLVIGSKTEYFNAVWVRNEWSRFLALMKKDRKKLLIPCYKDIDAYDIPEELSMFQAQDMSRIGFMQDILHGVKKVVRKTSAPAAAAPGAVTTVAASENSALLRRIQLFLEVQDFNSAIEYCERLLDKDPENGWVYFYRAMAELQISDEKKLLIKDLEANKSFMLAKRFADNELLIKIRHLEEQIRQQEEKERRLREEQEQLREAEKQRMLAESQQNTRTQISGRIKLLKEKISILDKKHSTFLAIAQAYVIDWKVDMFNDLKKAIAQEIELLESSSLLTDDIVNPVKEYSEKMISDADTLIESISGKKIFWKAIGLLIIILVILLIICPLLVGVRNFLNR